MEIALPTNMTKTPTDTKTCQVCERQCKMVRGKTSLHGYQRPGTGWINGRCFGAQELPWEQSCDTLKSYIAIVEAHRINLREGLKAITSPTLQEVTEYEREDRYAKPVAKTYKRGERYATKYMPSVDMFASIVSSRATRIEHEIASATREIDRQSARLATWKAS